MDADKGKTSDKPSILKYVGVITLWGVIDFYLASMGEPFFSMPVYCLWAVGNIIWSCFSKSWTPVYYVTSIFIFIPSLFVASYWYDSYEGMGGMYPFVTAIFLFSNFAVSAIIFKLKGFSFKDI